VPSFVCFWSLFFSSLAGRPFFECRRCCLFFGALNSLLILLLLTSFTTKRLCSRFPLFRFLQRPLPYKTHCLGTRGRRSSFSTVVTGHVTSLHAFSWSFYVVAVSRRAPRPLPLMDSDFFLFFVGDFGGFCVRHHCFAQRGGSQSRRGLGGACCTVCRRSLFLFSYRESE